jgi:hypothetical protein
MREELPMLPSHVVCPIPLRFADDGMVMDL